MFVWNSNSDAPAVSAWALERYSWPPSNNDCCYSYSCWPSYTSSKASHPSDFPNSNLSLLLCIVWHGGQWRSPRQLCQTLQYELRHLGWKRTTSPLEIHQTRFVSLFFFLKISIWHGKAIVCLLIFSHFTCSQNNVSRWLAKSWKVNAFPFQRKASWWLASSTRSRLATLLPLFGNLIKVWIGQLPQMLVL